ncbi:MAG TPA: hypothetical protein VES42_29625 [Pilimelia sp.]|nr:hypothetical protein [Pilimelia sp.]
MFILVLLALAALGGAVWVVLNRSEARRADRADRAGAVLMAISVLTLTAGLVYGVSGLW